MSNEKEAENRIAKELLASITSVSDITYGKLANQSIKSAAHDVKSNRQKKNSCSTRISENKTQNRIKNLQTRSNKSYSNTVFETFENTEDTTPNRINNLQKSCNMSDDDNVNDEPVEDVVDLTNANIQNNFPSYKFSR